VRGVEKERREKLYQVFTKDGRRPSKKSYLPYGGTLRFHVKRTEKKKRGGRVSRRPRPRRVTKGSGTFDIRGQDRWRRVYGAGEEIYHTQGRGGG